MKSWKSALPRLFMLLVVVAASFLFQSSAFAATIGQALTQPEQGWNRYDDINENILYVGSGWTKENKTDNYKTTAHFTASVGDYYSFTFYGTKFRLITTVNTTHSKNIEVSIDGTTTTYSEYYSPIARSVLGFESATLPLGFHTVIVTNKASGFLAQDAIDINDTGYLINTNLSAPVDLSAAASTEKIDLSWNAVTNATSYNVKRSTTAGGPYETIASNVTNTTYTDINVTSDIKYYYVVTAVNAVGESVYSNEASATLTKLSNPILDVTINEEKVTVGQEFVSDISLKNVNDIYAEDFKISYDTDLLEYLGYEEVTGYKVYNTPVDENGVLRFIVASQGEEYGINEDTVILKLHFRAKAVGTAKVDALKGRIADTEKEFDLEQESCLEDTVIIEQTDVNKSGEYTLLDLAIDARYYGALASTVDPVLYSAQQAGDEYVNDDDLLYIVNQMLNNSNYLPNLS